LTDPYRILGIAADASDDQIKAAYRQLAKGMHPDTGGDADAFMRMQRACDLLLDPLRRKVFDATGYDPEFADPSDLQGALVIETLVNEIVLDERQAGTFDPLAGMRAKLAHDIQKARFHIREMEGHKARIEGHIERLQRRPETDVLGFMLKARIEAISRSIAETRRKIDATERALTLLDAYSYDVDPAERSVQGLTSR
jgi:curved DNA-binding protein CbpA